MIIERSNQKPLRRPPFQKQAIVDFVPTIYYATLDTTKQKGKKFLKWLRWIAQYFNGLVKETSKNLLWSDYHNDFMNLLVHNGELFVSYDAINGEFIFWEVRDKFYSNSTLKYIKATKWDPNFNRLNRKDYVKEYKLINYVDGVYLQFINRDYHGLIMEWKDYIDQFIKLENNYLNACLFDTKKWEIHYLGTDVSEARKTINNLTNDESPFIYIINNIESGNLNNIAIKPLEATQSQSKAAQAFANLQDYISFVFNNEGLAAPIELKKERKTTSESKLDIYNTYNTESIIIDNLKNFATSLMMMYGITLSFDRNIDLTVVDNEGDEINGKEQENGEF
ncbi:MAG: hypothetical protein E7Y34_00985 [Mycoplasma sp.]|nr:hypothetical protein [Mycoplasma sp.]